MYLEKESIEKARRLVLEMAGKKTPIAEAVYPCISHGEHVLMFYIAMAFDNVLSSDPEIRESSSSLQARKKKLGDLMEIVRRIVAYNFRIDKELFFRHGIVVEKTETEDIEIIIDHVCTTLIKYFVTRNTNIQELCKRFFVDKHITEDDMLFLSKAIKVIKEGFL